MQLKAEDTLVSPDTERALRDAEVRNSLAIQGGNLALWEYFAAEQRWVIDRAWLSFLGVTIDPAKPELEAWESVFEAARPRRPARAASAVMLDGGQRKSGMHLPPAP